MSRCDVCEEDSVNLKYYPKMQCWVCPSCGNYKPKTLHEGYLTRNAQRTWKQQDKHAVDFIQPYAYDKIKRKMGLNPDFVKHYPDKLNEYITPEEVEREGMPKLSKYMKTIQKQKEIEKQLHYSQADFIGDEDNAIEKTLKG